MGRRRKLLVPEARMALQSLKADVLREKTDVAVKSPSHPPNSPDKGSWTTSEAGKIGGAVGGQMIQRLVELAKEELGKKP